MAFPQGTHLEGPERGVVSARTAGSTLARRIVLGAIALAGAVALGVWLTGTSHAQPAPRPAPPPSVARSPSPEPPTSLADPAPWLDYKVRTHTAALPLEARLFYRRGLMLQRGGGFERAARLVRAAAELDPTFVAPHLTLASWYLTRMPSQALLHYAAVLSLARENFLLQLALAANALSLGMQSVALALVAMVLLVLLVHQSELRHAWRERLAMRLSPVTSHAWSWALLVLPFLLGLGPALPALALVGLLWGTLRWSERVTYVACVIVLSTIPLWLGSLERLAAPMRESGPPFHGVVLLEGAEASPQRLAAYADLARRHPDDPFIQFGYGWLARRAHDPATAEAAYRRVLGMWPNDDRVMNDLGNAVFAQGRSDEALALYQRATRANPGNAAAWFNASQIHTQKFDYDAATDDITRASAIDFDLVKSAQAQSTSDGVLPVVDQWLAPGTFWHALATWRPGPGAPALPPAWRNRIETAGWPFSALCLAVAALSIAAGLAGQRSLPLRSCSNCGAVVCRRCAARRRELALCHRCVEIERRAESREFARVLLQQHARRVRGRAGLARTALATLVPGYGLLSFHRVASPLLLLSGSFALVLAASPYGTPFPFEARVGVAGTAFPITVLAAIALLIYLWSVGGYLSLAAREREQAAMLAAPQRSRSAQATRRTPAAAA